MITSREHDIFRMLATSFVLRGIWRWLKGEIFTRVEAVGISPLVDESLLKLCNAGRLTLASNDVFELTEQGRREARQMIGPSPF